MNFRLNTFNFLPTEIKEWGHLHPWIEIFSDRHLVCSDCPTHLAAEAEAYCLSQNARSERSLMAAHRSGLLP